MSESTNERGPPKPPFFDWLVNEIGSGKYKGLYWLDQNRTTFRIPWKHIGRKDLVDSDYKIFEEWAIVSGKYNEGLFNPSKWKINFRCALKSTKRFHLVTKSKDPDSDPAPYHVYEIVPLNCMGAANLPASTDYENDPEDDQLPVSPTSGRMLPTQSAYPPQAGAQQEIDFALGTLSLENPDPVQNGSTVENISSCNDTLQWVIQQANLNQEDMQEVSWAPALAEDSNCTVEAAFEPVWAYIDQNGCRVLGNAVNEPVENSYYEQGPTWLSLANPNARSQPPAILPAQNSQQTFLSGTNQFNNNMGGSTYGGDCFIRNVFVTEETLGNRAMNNPQRNMYQLPPNQQVMEDQNQFLPPAPPSQAAEPTLVNTVPSHTNAGTVPPHLDVSVYYRGRLLHEVAVKLTSCMFTYGNSQDFGYIPEDMQIIQFPNVEVLLDQKQAKYTLILLQNAGLVLYQRNDKIYAKRLGKCKVFCAFSKQLEKMAEHTQSPGSLPRDEEREIFDYSQFAQEFKDFCEGQIPTFPDYTIYLCFGQAFSASKPKESKLILVKLIPNVCKHCHDVALKDGLSSLNSNLSLQMSNSLFDMIESYMQTEEAG